MDVSFQKDSVNKNQKLTEIKQRFVKWIKNFDSKFWFFVLLCVMGVVFFIDSLVPNQFTTLFGGDYTAQQLSFYTNGYDDWWHFLKTGEFRFFDTNTYLGASNIGSNAFYYLFDPFFFLILLCPRTYIAQGMVVVTIFKIATAGMFFMQYMKVMGASDRAAKVSAFAYAFNGWMAWFLWFNHMTEICIVFPLMLWGVERILRAKKPWLLMFSTMLMGLTNYFFLIGMSIAAFFYAIFRFCQRWKLNSVKDNFEILGIGFIGFLAGILLSGTVALPSIMTSIEAPRSQNSEYLDLIKNALKEGKVDKVLSYIFEWKNFYFGGPSDFRHAYPLINFFFPCASCRGTPLTQFGNESYDNVATNIYSYVPMMLFFFPAFVRSMKEKKWSVIVATVLMLFALETPFCYYMFFGFTAPYGRWELFFITSFITFSGLEIDHYSDEPKWTKFTSYGLVISLTIFAGVMAQHLIDTNDNFIQRSPYISAYGATAVMCLYVTAVAVIMFLIKKPEKRHSWLMCFVAFEAAIMGFLTIEGHWCGSFESANNGLFYNNELYKVNQKIKNDDDSYYRCWSYLQNESGRNDGMRNDYNGLGCFHSIYNFNLNNFLNWTRIQDGGTFSGSGSWAGSYVWKNADIDKFLGVKYYFVQNNSPQWGWMGQDHYDYYQYNVPLDFEEITSQYQNGGFAVFKDTKPLNFATGFDTLISYPTVENSIEAEYSAFSYYSAECVLRNDELLLEGAMLNEQQTNDILAKYPSFAAKSIEDVNNHLDKTLLDSTAKHMYDLKQSSNGQVYTINTFFEDYAQRYLNAHAMTKDQLLDVENGGFTEVLSGESNNDTYGRYVSTITPLSGTTFDSIYDEKGYAVYVPYRYDDNYGADIYLVSDEGKIITWDRHQDDKYSIGGEKYRGLYVHPHFDSVSGTNVAPKLAKIIVCHREKSFVGLTNLGRIYTETYTQQSERMQHLYDDAVTNVIYRNDKFTFDTNYTSNKFVVTQMPFEKGWKVKVKFEDGRKENLEVMMVQGGYTGFVAPAGNVSYEMSFYPAYLDEGKLLSLAGAFMFLASFYGYYFYTEEFKKKEKISSLFSIK